MCLFNERVFRGQVVRTVRLAGVKHQMNFDRFFCFDVFHRSKAPSNESIPFALVLFRLLFFFVRCLELEYLMMAAFILGDLRVDGRKVNGFCSDRYGLNILNGSSMLLEKELQRRVVTVTDRGRNGPARARHTSHNMNLIGRHKVTTVESWRAESTYPFQTKYRPISNSLHQPSIVRACQFPFNEFAFTNATVKSRPFSK